MQTSTFKDQTLENQPSQSIQPSAPQINLRSFALAVEVYQLAKSVHLPGFLKDQLVRASSSIALNLAEGYGKSTTKDRRRYFLNALGSLREVQGIARLEPQALTPLLAKLDHLGASLYKLTR